MVERSQIERFIGAFEKVAHSLSIIAATGSLATGIYAVHVKSRVNQPERDEIDRSLESITNLIKSGGLR